MYNSARLLTTDLLKFLMDGTGESPERPSSDELKGLCVDDEYALKSDDVDRLGEEHAFG